MSVLRVKENTNAGAGLVKNIYPIVIWVVGFCIVLRYALLDYALVSDAGNEFIVYKTVVETGTWQVIKGHGLLSSCLWTSYMPAMFQRLFNTDIVMTFKLFPCFIFPALPVVVYYLARKMVSPLNAFLASAFLMVQIYFLWIPQFARVGVSLLFWGLALLVIFNDNLKFGKKIILFVVLGACLVTSHYGTTYASLFVLGIACMTLVALRYIKKTHFPYLKALLVFTCVLVVGVILWHGLFNPIPLSYGRSMVTKAIEAETFVAETFKVDEDGYGYWSLEAREEVVKVAFGKTLSSMNIPQKIEFVICWLSILLMSWGLALTVKRYGLGSEWGMLMVVCYLTIVIGVIIPVVSVRYGIARVYFHMVVVLSGCFVVGSRDIAKRLKMPSWFLVVVILAGLGLCASGLMHNMFGLSR